MLRVVDDISGLKGLFVGTAAPSPVFCTHTENDAIAGRSDHLKLKEQPPRFVPGPRQRDETWDREELKLLFRLEKSVKEQEDDLKDYAEVRVLA